MNPADTCFGKRNDFVTREIAGETVVVPVCKQAGDLDSIFTLNELGTMIWKLIDGRVTVSEITDAVCRKYQVSPDEAERDALQFLLDLETAGLISACPKGNILPSPDKP